MSKENRGIRISFNSPVILVFSIICLLVLGLGYLTGGVSDDLLFCVYRSSFTDPLTYFRFFGHVLGHANWEHFIGNITMILVIGLSRCGTYGCKRHCFCIYTACKYDEYRGWKDSAYFYSCGGNLHRWSDKRWDFYQ